MQLEEKTNAKFHTGFPQRHTYTENDVIESFSGGELHVALLADSSISIAILGIYLTGRRSMPFDGIVPPAMLATSAVFRYRRDRALDENT